MPNREGNRGRLVAVGRWVEGNTVGELAAVERAVVVMEVGRAAAVRADMVPAAEAKRVAEGGAGRAGSVARAAAAWVTEARWVVAWMATATVVEVVGLMVMVVVLQESREWPAEEDRAVRTAAAPPTSACSAHSAVHRYQTIWSIHRGHIRSSRATCTSSGIAWRRTMWRIQIGPWDLRRLQRPSGEA